VLLQISNSTFACKNRQDLEPARPTFEGLGMAAFSPIEKG
jgi:hypothetical protein